LQSNVYCALRNSAGWVVFASLYIYVDFSGAFASIDVIWLIRSLNMAKKTMSEKEMALLDTIADAKKKLDALQNKQKIALGAMAIKHGLHTIDEKKLDSAFKKLSLELNVGN
jgi:hypothetical protein